MKLGLIGRLFPVLFSRVVYGYTAAAVPEMDIRAFREKHRKEYEAMVNRTPSVGSMKDNMFAAVMYGLLRVFLLQGGSGTYHVGSL